MTSVKKFLVGIKPSLTNSVTFGDGLKGKVMGVGKLDYAGQPRLDDVLFVEGLNSNLISISQLHDQGLKVNFTNSECLIKNEKDEVIMKGSRSKDNCYLWSPEDTKCFSTCLKTKETVGRNSKLEKMVTAYKVTQDVRTLYCDNMSAINISKNPI